MDWYPIIISDGYWLGLSKVVFYVIFKIWQLIPPNSFNLHDNLYDNHIPHLKAYDIDDLFIDWCHLWEVAWEMETNWRQSSFDKEAQRN